MNEITAYFTDEKFIISLFTAIIATIYTITAKKILTNNRERKEKKKEDFFKVLVKGLENKTIQNHKDLVNIYRGSTNLSTEDLNYRYGLNKWLRELLSKIIIESPELDFNKENTNNLVASITEFIDNNEQVSPFSDLPETERNMLSDITAFINSSDSVSAHRKIKELGSVIQTRNEEQKKIESQNKWAIPLAIIGVILTVIFGFVSIIK